MAGDANELVLGDIVALTRGTTYQSAFLGRPGPVLLGLASIKRNGGFRDDNLKTYGGECPSKLTLRPGDIFVSLKDVTQAAELLGSIARVPPHVPAGRVTQDTVKLTFTRDDIPSRYVYWLLRTPVYREYCRAHAIGTTNLALSREDFLAFPIPRPTDREMTLVDVLDALDDKIDLNRRMNATLEAMARALFQSWFVDFDPVRAKMEGRQPVGMDAETAALFPDSFQDSPIGRVPLGWKAGKLGEFTQVGIGGAWGEEAPGGNANVGVLCLRGIDCHNLAERKLPNIPVRYLSKRQYIDRRLQEGCILVEGSGSFCGRSMVWLTEFEHLVGDSICYSNFCKRLDPLCSPSQALVCWMQLRSANDTGELSNFRTGTAFPNLDIHGALLRLDVVCPPRALCDSYMELYRRWLRLDLIEESITLATMRDSLLPKLLSGDLPCSQNFQV